MKSFYLLVSVCLFFWGCPLSSGDCPDPAPKVENIDFNSITLEAGSHMKVFVNNKSTVINAFLILRVRDRLNETLLPAFDQNKLNLEVDGNKINYAHENKILPGGYGCPGYIFPELTVNVSGAKNQLVIKDSSNQSRSWENVTSIDTSIFPVMEFSIANDSFKISVKSSPLLELKKSSLVVAEDSSKTYGFNSSIDRSNHYYILSDFSQNGYPPISEIRQKKYWVSIYYSQERVASLSSLTHVVYAKQLPDSISTLINEARITRIPANYVAK